MIFTPDMNDGKHIFVFGSNDAGRHGAGAAKEALEHWGAEYGKPLGLVGQSYAIPTKDSSLSPHPLDLIARRVRTFLIVAKNYSHYTFLVTAIGCGLAGYSEEQIKPMFKDAPDNCILPEGWRDTNGN